MAYKVKLTERAALEAESYARFILERSEPEAAERWLEKIDSTIKSLRELPGRFPLIPESDELKKEYRQFLHFSHRVIYRIEEESKTVLVLSIYHGARRPLSSQDI